MLGAVAAVVVGVVGSAVPVYAGGQNFAGTAVSTGLTMTTQTAKGFSHPDDSYRPKTRWWWTCGEITAGEIKKEMASIAAAGFGGVEILCMFAADPATQGWGSAAMQDRMQVALDTGKRLGLDVDFTVGPAWPLAVPGVTPDSPDAAQELAVGTATVAGGKAYTGAAPAAPEAASGVTKQTLVAAQAVKCASTCKAGSGSIALKDSSVDLTADAADGSISWTAPEGGEWQVFGFWRRGTGQATVVGADGASGKPAYVVDHFAKSGADAAIDFWQKSVLTSQMKASLRKAGGDLFEDSLELDSALHWTPDFLAEFKHRRGYDLRPFLPVLTIDRLHRQYSPVSVEDLADYVFSANTDRRVREDYYQTLTDLYVANHVEPLKRFAHQLGLQYRAQPYAETTEIGQVGLAIDVPETEGLVTSLSAASTERLQQYRIQAGAAHLGHKPIYSTECCAVLGGAYGQTWEDLLGRFSASFVGGVNQVVLHGFAYENGLGMGAWPGFSPFTLGGGNGFSEAFGPRQATWADTPQITDWLSRMQYVLRQGRPRVDVAIYRQSMDRSLSDAIFKDPNLSRAGYSSDYVSSSLIDLPTSVVKDRRLDPSGPGYRALVLDNQRAISVNAARRVLSFAKAGLPVVVVGDAPSRTSGALERGVSDREVTRLMDSVLTQRSVRTVGDESKVPAMLAKLGARPALESAEPTGLLSTRRSTRDGDVYVIYNPSDDEVSTDVALEGDGSPAELNPWTGDIAAIGEWNRRAGRTIVSIAVAPHQTRVIGVGNFAHAPVNHALSSEAEVAVDGGRLVIRSNASGTFRTVLSTGRTVKTVLPKVPAARTLDRWHLAVSDWHRGADGALEKTDHELEVSRLEPWSQIPELQDVSGVGTYTTTMHAPQGWTGGRHARLSLGDVFDTFRVKVNGEPIPAVDQVTGSVDISRYLKGGSNTIEVRVATTLRNRLRVTPGFPGQASEARQDYGLIGPVTVTPYGQAALR
ncbi:hypothetical protein ASE12_14295 [Aeromicrobium sp. Root236]|nr:hypothetical protein ASE12_14295 [Aeromicrobium sp. Root236]